MAMILEGFVRGLNHHQNIDERKRATDATDSRPPPLSNHHEPLHALTLSCETIVTGLHVLVHGLDLVRHLSPILQEDSLIRYMHRRIRGNVYPHAVEMSEGVKRRGRGAYNPSPLCATTQQTVA